MEIWKAALLFFGCHSLILQVSASIDIVELKNGTKALAVKKSELHLSGRRCEDGYVVNAQNASTCLPYCSSQCPGGYCSQPEYCTCLPGSVQLPNGECAGSCPTECRNGYCTNNECGGCYNGYMMTPERTFCTPFCSRGCPNNEVCVGPDRCECRRGYKRSNATNVFSTCVPKCKLDCLNGVCVQPGVCACNPGYQNVDGVCQAACWMDCKNGYCVKENECHCKPGYLLSVPSLKCVDMCVGCEIGTCIGPNKCKCPTGYKYEQKKCQPSCLGGCGRGGICYAPGKCKCKAGYKMHKILKKCGKEKCKKTLGILKTCKIEVS